MERMQDIKKSVKQIRNIIVFTHESVHAVGKHVTKLWAQAMGNAHFCWLTLTPEVGVGWGRTIYRWMLAMM